MRIERFFKKVNISLALIVLIPTLLNIIWFRSGNIMGVAESGLPFYNFQIAYDTNKDAWAHYALGFPTNISIAAKPTYWFLAQLQNLGIPGFLLQASFLWIVLVISGISIYMITKNIFPDLKEGSSFIAVLFYWFNPFSMVNVWNRFLNNFFVFYLLLPLALLLFLKGLQTRRYIYAFVFGLVSVIFSYSLSSVTFSLLLWLVLFYTAIFNIFIYKDRKFRVFVIKYFIIALFFWCTLHIWWLSQTLSYVYSGSFSAVEQTSFSSANNQLIFTILSQKLGNLIYILRFEHGSFFSNSSELLWVKLYLFPVISFLSFSISLIIFLPLFLKSKKSSVLFLSGLTILGIFLSKGNNPPFGEIFNLPFTKIGFLQAFRNAFEKFGFLLPLSGAPLFAYGSNLLQLKLANKWGKYIYLLLVFWLIGIFGLPFFTGWVFMNSETPANIPSTGYQVKVPQYYKDAANWLSTQKKDFRLLAFPLGSEGITYNWEKGYTGVELSNQLLPTPAISFQTNIPFYDDISSSLEKTFLNGRDFTRATNLLNAKYIMFRDDIDWHTRRMRDPQIIFNELKNKEKNGQFKLIKDFGGLSFWENLNWVDKEVYASSEAVSVSPLPKISDSQFLPDNNSALIGDKVNLNSSNLVGKVIHPTTRLSLEDNLDQSYDGGQDIFPHVKFSPTSKIYNFLLLKERIELEANFNISDKINSIVQLLGKRLVEAKSEINSGNTRGVLIALNEYKNLFDYMNSIFPDYAFLKSDTDKQLINQEKLYRIFLKHKLLIDNMISSSQSNLNLVSKLQSTQKLINTGLIADHIEPVFGFKEEERFPVRRRIAYEFNITDPGEYELRWGDSEIDKYYKQTLDNKTILQLDNKLLPIEVVVNSSGSRSFGQIYLDKGLHEIAMNTPEEINLVDVPAEIDLKAAHDEAKQAFLINNYDPYAQYTISFDYWIKKGSGLETFIESNNSLISSGEKVADFWQMLGSDSYNFDEKHFATSFKFNNTTDAATLFLRVTPWNDCELIFNHSGKEKCQDKNFRRAYDRTTEVIVKNVSINRKLTDEPVLVRFNMQPIISSPLVTFKKVDNTKYIVTVKDAKNPYVLILSELFDPGWKLFNSNGEPLNSKHFLVNTYANGWSVDKLGGYQLVIEFTPQNLLRPTERVSQVVFIVSSIFLIWSFRRKYVKDN